MKISAAIAAAVLSAEPIADASRLEPSVLNEVCHALSIAPTNSPAVAPDIAEKAFETNGLDTTAIAIKLVSLQKSDGRWLSGTNDVTAAAVRILESL